MPLHTRKAYLSYARECQKDRNWITIPIHCVVYPLTKPSKLGDLRQATRLPQDYTGEDFGFQKSIWVVCWIPKHGVKCYIRTLDLYFKKLKNKQRKRRRNEVKANKYIYRLVAQW